MNVKDLTRQVLSGEPMQQFSEWTAVEAALQAKFNEAQAQVHAALCGKILYLNYVYVYISDRQLFFSYFR